jgi:hypothetical protein
MIDLEAVWDHHVLDVLTDSEEDGRNPRKLAASDLHSCDFALSERLRGAQQIARTMATFSAFERGHAYEDRIWKALRAFVLASEGKLGYSVERAATTSLEGITGHPDFTVIDNATGEIVAVIDPTTTASKFADWKYGHALKSASYALALGCDQFCEWVFCIGFGGNILQQKAHWFNLDDVALTPGGKPMADEIAGTTWRQRVILAVSHKKATASLPAGASPDTVPPFDPIDGEPEAWRCKGYCDTVCPRNQKLAPMATAKKAS